MLELTSSRVRTHLALDFKLFTTMEVLGRDGESTLVGVKLEDAVAQIVAIQQSSLEEKGLMIYWVHGLNAFMFFYPGDKNYRVEMKRMRRE